MLNKRPHTISGDIETLDSRYLASNVLGSEHKLPSLERALITIGRDSALRHIYLRKRWRGLQAIYKATLSERR